MKRLPLLLLFLLSLTKLSAQLFVEDFESGSGNFSTSKPQCNDNSNDYFTITDGSDINGVYNGSTGSYFAAQDIDGTPCITSTATGTMTFTGINISGCTGLSLSIDLAEDDDGGNQDWDGADFMHITVSIDGGATQNIIWVEGATTGTNTEPQIDTDFNGLGDGAVITSTFQNFSNSIAGTGALLDITITFQFDSGDEDIAIDNLTVTGTGCAGCTPLTEPVNQITGQTTSNITCSSADLAWTNSTDGTYALVAISTSAITGSPTDAVAYTANPVFGSGSILNAGEFVVFNGTTGAVSVTGLAPGTTYFVEIFAYNGPTANCSENYLTGGTTFTFTTAGPVTQPTNESTGLASSNLDCFSASVNWTNGVGSNNSIVVISTSAITGAPTDGTSYAANANYGSGDILNAGEYVVFNGSGSSVNITGLSEGVTYFITVFEYNGVLTDCEENYLTGGNSISFTTTTGCAAANPQITSILYNSCSGSEAINEFFTFTTGTSAVEVDSININYPSSGVPDYCNVGCGANTNLNNPTYVNDLNVLAGCAIFVYADPIPPNSTVMVFAGNPPSSVLDFSSQCGAAGLPIYVIFNNNTNGSASGRFSNSNGSPQTLSIYTGNGQSDTVSYIPTSQAVADGASVNFDAAGNPLYFNNASCIYPLPIELTSFSAYKMERSVVVNWETASENNNDYFILEKSHDGINYFPIATISGNGNSTEAIKYSHTDVDTKKGISYYRLKQFDFDGKFRYSYPVKVVDTDSPIYYAENWINLNFKTDKNQSYTVNIYNLSGQLMLSQPTNGNQSIGWENKGFYIVEIPELQIRQKIVCN